MLRVIYFCPVVLPDRDGVRRLPRQRVTVLESSHQYSLEDGMYHMVRHTLSPVPKMGETRVATRCTAIGGRMVTAAIICTSYQWARDK